MQKGPFPFEVETVIAIEVRIKCIAAMLAISGAACHVKEQTSPTQEFLLLFDEMVQMHPGVANHFTKPLWMRSWLTK